MKKNVWILNHYATNMFSQGKGRHLWFGENLIKKGYSPTIFCASTYHNSQERIDIPNGYYTTGVKNDIPFVFVKTSEYENNGISRIKNMLSFYKNILKSAKVYSKNNHKPDVILASSVHPLTLVAGLKLAKIFKVPCICEVRDLWPESLVAYGYLKKEGFFTKILYQLEKRIYMKSDHLIMTWPGGKDYIKTRGWEEKIDLKKVSHISNGILISQFDNDCEVNEYFDEDLQNERMKSFVYTGSIRRVNNLDMLVDAAKYLQNKNISEVQILVYGSGDQLEKLKSRCQSESIYNIIFKGKVDRKYIPSILKKSYVNLLHNTSSQLDKYGQSQNKLFEYLASGKCILQTYETNYNIFEKYDCGFTISTQTPENIAEKIIELCNMKKNVNKKGENARNAVYNYDFEILTEKLIKIIENK